MGGLRLPAASLLALLGASASAQVARAPVRVPVVGAVGVSGAAALAPAALAPGVLLSAPSLTPLSAPSAFAAAPAPVLAAAAPAPSPVPDAPAAAAALAARPLRLLITGPPGVGKTTFGKMLAADYGMIHISVGELLRERAASDPALAETMSHGDLVDSDLVRRVVTERLSRPDAAEKGFILDGFPRRPEEAGVIDSWLQGGGVLDGMIHLEASDAELMRRILARGRMDDSEEVFRKRMEIYRRQTRPVLEHFRGTLRLLEADASAPDARANYAKVRALVDDLLARPPSR
ncbi:MAG: nucleoside monophosphate kinase [Elusimicrobia bacterium]|nr:nucleoside monophosphate kinase [Elusimicrobiota bacterium]